MCSVVQKQHTKKADFPRTDKKAASTILPLQFKGKIDLLLDKKNKFMSQFGDEPFNMMMH